MLAPVKPRRRRSRRSRRAARRRDHLERDHGPGGRHRDVDAARLLQRSGVHGRMEGALALLGARAGPLPHGPHPPGRQADQERHQDPAARLQPRQHRRGPPGLGVREPAPCPHPIVRLLGLDRVPARRPSWSTRSSTRTPSSTSGPSSAASACRSSSACSPRWGAPSERADHLRPRGRRLHRGRLAHRLRLERAPPGLAYTLFQRPSFAGTARQPRLLVTLSPWGRRANGGTPRGHAGARLPFPMPTARLARRAPPSR